MLHKDYIIYKFPEISKILHKLEIKDYIIYKFPEISKILHKLEITNKRIKKKKTVCGKV